MKINAILIIMGLTLFAVGIYRETPVSLDRKFLLSNGPMITIFLILLAICFLAGGDRYVKAGLENTLFSIAHYMPMLAMIMLMFGFSMVAAKHFQPQLDQLLSGQAGYLGVLTAAFLSPTSTGLAKFVDILWSNPELKIKLLYFLTATPLISINLFFIRQIGLGPEIAWTMYKMNFAIAILLLPFFWLWGKFA